MPVEIIMPKVDMDMASGRIMIWHIEEGGHVTKGAPLFDIETDKAAMEVEAEAAGYVHHRAAPGAEIAIGQPVAWLYQDGEPVGDPPARAAVAAEEPQPEPQSEPSLEPAAEPASAPLAELAEKPRASPRARRLAGDRGLVLDGIAGSGPRGRIQEADIADFLTSPARAGPAGFTSQTGPLSVSRMPGSGPPLVMIHGFASDALSWAALEPALGGRAAIRIDLPSHGKSPLRRIGDFRDLARELRAAVDGLGLDSFDLVGHSLGGALALALADIRPRKLRQMTLLAPSGLGPEINGACLTGLCAASRPESLAPWLRVLVQDETRITDAYARLAHAARPAAMRAAQAAMAEALFPDGVQGFDLRAALARLATPTRIIWGKQDRILPWRHALQAPGKVALHLFDQIGHVPQFEAPDLVGELIAKPL